MNAGWREFAEVCRADFGTCPFQAELIAACGGHEDIAWATWFHLRAHSLEWLDRAIPALGKRRPARCIAAGKGDQVRECLWRMP